MSCRVSSATPAVTPDGFRPVADSFETPSVSYVTSIKNLRCDRYSGEIGLGVATTGVPFVGTRTTFPTRLEMTLAIRSASAYPPLGPEPGVPLGFPTYGT